MAETFIFLYATLAMFVVTSMQANQRADRPSPQMMTMVGWGLFSLSSTLSLLLLSVAVALAFGIQMPLPESFNAPLF
jgi:hypothetical protein